MAQQDEQIDREAIAAEIDAEIRALRAKPKTQDVRAVRRKFSRRLKNVAAEEVIGVAWQLLTRHGRRWVAYELIYKHTSALRSLRPRQIKQFGRGINSWGSTDVFAGYLSGPAWREGQLSDRTIQGWARSGNRWWRRAALVSTTALNVKARGGRGDVPRTLKVCCILVDDRDDMVVKAMSWALRELVQHDPKAVRGFLAKHEDALAARVKREVRNKLTTGLKNPRRR